MVSLFFFMLSSRILFLIVRKPCVILKYLSLSLKNNKTFIKSIEL